MTENLNLKATVDTSSATASVGSLKKQLREAQAEVTALSDKFGATSKQAIEAAKRAGELKDKIGDAKALTEAFNPDAKFKSLTASLSGVAGGFGAVQGAMALFGAESEDVQKTLLKVQSAMAISQGLQAIGESIDSFKQMKAVAIDAFKGIKAAIGSTGIGLLVVAIGTLVTYWDDIKAAVGGVSEEQKKLNESSKENLKTQEDKLTAIDGQTNQLRLQGKSEREILELKLKQTDEAIKAAEVNILNSKSTRDAQVEASQRNKDILQGIIKFITLPITILLETVDAVGKALGKNFGLSEGFSGGLAKLVFDPEEVAKQGNDTIKEAEKLLNALKEKRAGTLLSIQGLNKTAGENRSRQLESEVTEYQKQQDLLLKIELDAFEKRQEQRKKLGINGMGYVGADGLTNEEREKEKEKQRKRDEEADIKYKKFNEESNTNGLGKILAIKAAAIVAEIAQDKKNKEDLLSAQEQFEDAKFNIALSGLNLIGQLAGQGTAIAKAAALSQIIIDTGRGFASGLTIAQQSAKGAGPAAAFAFPIFYATQIAAVLGAVGKAKSILSQVPGGGGVGGTVSPPSIGSSAPMIAPVTPQAQSTTIGQQAVGETGMQTIRAYVVESDVTNSQQRVEAIRHRARFS
jgi:hypothetical protein